MDPRPLIFDLDLLFLAQRSGKNAPRLVSDFNEWAASDGCFAGSGEMQRIGQTNWYAYIVEAIPKARF